MLSLAVTTARFDTKAMRGRHDALRKVDFPRNQSNILRIDNSRMSTALQNSFRTRIRQREAEPTHPKQLIDSELGPHVGKQLFGENGLFREPQQHSEIR